VNVGRGNTPGPHGGLTHAPVIAALDMTAPLQQDFRPEPSIDPLTGAKQWSSTDSGVTFGTESAVLSAGNQLIILTGDANGRAPGVNASMVGTGDRFIGGAAGMTEYFDGLLDEVRLEKAARSADWIWACTMTMGHNADFTTYGSVR
jgi:hypothetical protein